MPVTLDMSKAQPISIDMSQAQPIADPTTAGQPNSLAPAFQPKPDDVTGMMAHDPTLQSPTQAAVGGFGKQILRDALFGPVDSSGKAVFSGMTPDDNLNVDPNSPGEQLGSTGAKLAEYALPAGRLEKAMTGAALLPRMAAQGALSAGTTATHGATDPLSLATSAATGAAGPIIGEAAKGAPAFFLNKLGLNDAQANAVAKLGPAMSRSSLASKATDAATNAGKEADAALSSYAGPNFDARPGLQMIDEAMQRAAAEGKPQEYIDALSQLSNSIKQRTALNDANQIVSQRTNPANLGLQKFRDTIQRVRSSSAPISGEVGDALEGQLNNAVPAYGPARQAQQTYSDAANVLNTKPEQPSIADWLKDTAMKGGASGLAGLLLGHGETGAAIGAGTALGLSGLRSAYNSVPGSTLLTHAVQNGLPPAFATARAGYMTNRERQSEQGK